MQVCKPGEHGAETKPAQPVNSGISEISVLVNTCQLNALNTEPSTALKPLLLGGEEDYVMKSDADEQLLIHIPFSQPVKLHSFNMVAPQDGTGPMEVKLFINQPNMDFGEADSVKATQTFTMTAEDLLPEKTTMLKFVNFQNVTHLTVFIASNLDDEEATSVNRIRLFGQPIHAMNLSELKKQG